MSYENKNELGINDTTCVTKPVSSKNECNNTGKKWVRKCKVCSGDIFHSSCKSYKKSNRNNSPCRHCACVEREKNRDKSMYKTDSYRRAMSESLKIARTDEFKYGDSFKEKCRKNAISHWASNEGRLKKLKTMQSDSYRQKHRENSINMWKKHEHIAHMKEIHASDEYRKKRRIITRKLLKQRLGGGRLAVYSKKACDFIDRLNKLFEWELQHGQNGGEYEIDGYAIDGYDLKRNIVVEYDEPYHYVNGITLREKDVRRQCDIIKSLRPTEFWRYNEVRKTFTNIIDGRVLWL